MARARYLSTNRREEVEDLAEAVAEEHFNGKRVEPAELLAINRITLSCNDYGGAFDGLLEHRNGRFHVYCNTKDGRGLEDSRTRFTLGHELGHFYIDEHRHVLASGSAPAHGSFVDFSNGNLAEQEADSFASALLMPRAKFVRAGNRRGKNLSGVIQLAEEFGSSITSTAIRYARLEVTPCAVIRWSAEGMSWKWISTSAYAARFRGIQVQPSCLVPSSPTRRALEEQSNPEAGYFTQGTTAAIWLPWLPADARQNLILIEEAIRLGRYGVLTMLFPDRGSF
ncbi:MAG: ImmA/IrrE family metallo-endopeptidase [Myxococcota bacterium]